MPGFVELIFLIVILMIVFGFRRFPAIGEAIGRSIHNRRHPQQTARADDEPSSDRNPDDTPQP